jgi:hypothetical protein
VSKQHAEIPEWRTKERKGVAHDSAKSQSPKPNELEFVCIPSDPLSEAEVDSLARLFAQAIVRKLRKTRKI